MKLFAKTTLAEQRAALAAKLTEAEQAAVTARNAIVDGGDPAAAGGAQIKAEALAGALADLDKRIADDEAAALQSKREAERKEAAAKLTAVADQLEAARVGYGRWLEETYSPLVRAIDGVKGSNFSAQLGTGGPEYAAQFLFDREAHDLRGRAKAIAAGSGSDFLRAALGRRPI